MAKGPIITDEVRLLISEVHIAHPHWQAKDVQHEVNVRMRGKGPKISAIQKQLTAVRKASASVSRSLESAWSLGISADYGIPLEANEAIMKIWEWGVAVGITLTIREAQWVTRLRGIVPDDQLFSWAVRYAGREQVCSLLGREETYTVDLDLMLGYSRMHVNWSTNREEIFWTTIAKWAVLAGKHYNIHELASFSKRADELGSWDRAKYASMSTPASRKVEKYLSINPQHKQTLGENADIVYVLWLRLFGSCPKWKNMTLETKNEMAMRLHKEVELKEKKIKDTGEAYQDSTTEDEKTRLSFKIFASTLKWLPSEELLQDAGVPQDHERWKIVTLESEQSTRTYY